MNQICMHCQSGAKENGKHKENVGISVWNARIIETENCSFSESHKL